MDADERRRDATFVRRVLIAIGLVALALALWRLRTVLLMVFGAMLVAFVLRALADLLRRRLRLGEGWALAAAGLVVLAVVAGGFVLMGAQLQAQVAQLAERLPAAWASLEARVAGSRLEPLLERASEVGAGGGGAPGGLVTGAAGVLGAAANGLVNLFIVIAGGVFLASQPRLYRRGLLELLPRHRRPQAGELVDACGRALRGWLTAQLTLMAVVAVAVSSGLYLIGLPSALALGLFAGLVEFVPFLGPIASAIPALLLALSQGTTPFLLTLALYVLIQQLEGNLLWPLLFRRTVDLPPALTIFAVIAFGTLFGLLGLLLAAPLTVVAYVAATQLYVRDTLGEPAAVPGEAPPDAGDGARAGGRAA